MRRPVFALIAALALTLAAAGPASAQLNDYKNGGSIPQCKYSDGQLNRALGEITPDVEQYAPGYADELRNGRGGACPNGGGPGGSGTTADAQDRVEGVPAPPSAGGGSGGPGGADGSGSGTTGKIADPPVPVAAKRTRFSDVSSPAISTQPAGPDVPTWVLLLGAALLLLSSVAGALYLFGADFSRFTRPLGVAGGEARARTSDRAVELWESVRFGR